MPIPLINNFKININAPIDDRVVASNSTARDNISYKYDGMLVYTLDDKKLWSYDYNGLTWSLLNGSNTGIYVSGSLVGDTYIYSGTISNAISSRSNSFIIYASASNNIIFSNYFNRHTITGDTLGVEFKNEYKFNNNTSYISYNPLDASYNGNIEFGINNTRKITIVADGSLRFWTPTYSLNIISSSVSNSQNYYLPNKSGIFALNSDINLQNATNNGNTTSNTIILQNYSSGNLFTGNLSNTGLYFNKNNALKSGLDINGLKLSDNSNNVASIVVNSLSDNYTYSIPSGGGTFQMRKHVIYQYKNMSGNGNFTTYNIFRTDDNSGRFVITRIVKISTHITPYTVLATYFPTINIGWTYPNYSDAVIGWYDTVGAGPIPTNNLVVLPTLVSNYGTIPPSTLVYVYITNQTTRNYTFDIYVEGYYTDL